MKWKYTKEKFVITKNGVNMAFNKEELDLLKKIIYDIESGENKYETKDNRNL